MRNALLLDKGEGIGTYWLGVSVTGLCLEKVWHLGIV